MNVIQKDGKQFLKMSQQDWLNLGAAANWNEQTIYLPDDLHKESAIRDYWNALKNVPGLGSQLDQHRQLLQTDSQKLEQIIEALTQVNKNQAASEAKKLFLSLSVPSQQLVRGFLKANNPTLPEFHDAILKSIDGLNAELQNLNKGNLTYDQGYPSPQPKLGPYHQVMQALKSLQTNQLNMISKEIARLLKSKTVSAPEICPSR